MAFDFSEEAKTKTLKLAQQHEVSLNYDIMNVADFSTENIQFDVIGLFFAHFPTQLRQDFHQKVTQVVKTSGYVIFEAFHKKQLNDSSGGPKDLAKLFSVEEVEKEFAGLKILTLEDKIIQYLKVLLNNSTMEGFLNGAVFWLMFFCLGLLYSI